MRHMIEEAVRSLIPNPLAPRAVSMTGACSLAPNAPKSGTYAVQTWAATTQYLAWKVEPEGWADLAEREEAGQSIPSFIIIGDEKGDRFCIPLNSGCFEGLYTAPSANDLHEIVEWICDLTEIEEEE